MHFLIPPLHCYHNLLPKNVCYSTQDPPKQLRNYCRCPHSIAVGKLKRSITLMDCTKKEGGICTQGYSIASLVVSRNGQWCCGLNLETLCLIVPKWEGHPPLLFIRKSQANLQSTRPQSTNKQSMTTYMHMYKK